ncbi:metalloprotease [Plakobranchus ocellatus]|uniref:Metalloprotease n=1 Tax=Plakobranchus ocellatus TaxID=259542 RepID=A0AAV3Z1T0_9GAST|nr:metalloprotease [Plakobranchus ocellatus]
MRIERETEVVRGEKEKEGGKSRKEEWEKREREKRREEGRKEERGFKAEKGWEKRVSKEKRDGARKKEKESTSWAFLSRPIQSNICYLRITQIHLMEDNEGVRSLPCPFNITTSKRSAQVKVTKMRVFLFSTVAVLAAVITVCRGSLGEVSGRITLPRGVNYDPNSVLQFMASAMNIGEHTGLRTTSSDLGDTGRGVKRCRLEQTFNGYEVFGSGLEAETDLGGHLTGQYNGVVADDLDAQIPDPEACQRNVQDIIDIAMAEEGYTPPPEYESGGINEAFSDIAGEAAELFAGRDGGNDFNVGFDLFKNPTRSLRYFRRPEDDGRSISTYGQYYNGMDVHYSSGIFNIAFYRLVADQNMDLFQAYGCFLHANRHIWTSRSSFQAGACGVIKACYDLGYDHNKARRAFEPTGLDVSNCNLQGLAVELIAGDAKEKVLVGVGRSPIIKLVGNGATGSVEAVAEDFSTVTIEITSDEDGLNVVASGENEASFTVDPDVPMYAKLSSNAETDTPVTLIFN